MNALADTVLPLIRTRADLHRWSAANAHGRHMHDAVDILEQAVPSTDPVQLYSVTHKALISAITVIARADDSSGTIGHACRRLLRLHPTLAPAAKVAPGKLVDWMIKFQFDAHVDYFELDPVAYSLALGEQGMSTYRARLRDIESSLGARPTDDGRWAARHTHEWFTLDWNAQRLAVLDRDVEAIIRTHARDRKVAAWLEDTAKGFEEIGEIDLAIAWAKQATDFDLGHQSLNASDYWCELLDSHRPAESLQARLFVFRRWPSATTAAHLYTTAGTAWSEYHDEVITTLSAGPSDAVLFARATLQDVEFAWDLARTLDLDSDRTWSDLINAYEKIDPVAVLPIHRRLIESDLVNTGVQHYRRAARRLMKMRKLAAGSDTAAEIDLMIADLRVTHRRRPTLSQEFDRAGLP